MLSWCWLLWKTFIFQDYTLLDFNVKFCTEHKYTALSNTYVLAQSLQNATGGLRLYEFKSRLSSTAKKFNRNANELLK